MENKFETINYDFTNVGSRLDLLFVYFLNVDLKKNLFPNNISEKLQRKFWASFDQSQKKTFNLIFGTDRYKTEMKRNQAPLSRLQNVYFKMRIGNFVRC